MKIFLYLYLFCITSMLHAQNNIKATQFKFERVENAYNEKWPDLEKALKLEHLGSGFYMAINAYKAEGKLEVWLKKASDQHYKRFRTYDFCAHSGTLGPKVIEGDGQTPEGFYYINVFNPMSSFHLSLGLNYPNATDLVRTGKNRKPGNDIYIHGNCVTVGCIPLTDDKIKEVYILALEASQAGQEKIPVNIYPFRMTESNLNKHIIQFPTQLNFWRTLQTAYTFFEKQKRLATVQEINGNYVIK